MSKIVFFGIPAHGHTNPTLGVVKELARQGHHVRYYSYNMFKEKIESAGAIFVPCDDYDAEFKLTYKDSARIGKDLAFSVKILVDTTLALEEGLSAEIEEFKPDCIVADSMALWGKAIALKHNIPFVCSTTTFAFNKFSSKIIKQSPIDLFRMIFAIPKTQKQLKRLKDKGYPVNNILDIIGTDDNAHTVVYTSPEFQPSSETFSDKFLFAGPSISLPEESIEKAGKKLIYISMGTVNNDMMPFYKNCINAFKNTEFQVIMSVGNIVSLSQFKELPDNISVYPHIDQLAVLEKADVFISHGGMNSVSESLYYEVPLVLIPQTSEQKGVSARVCELGAGVIAQKTDSVSLLAYVNEILSNSSFKIGAEAISKGFKKCSGAKGAANKIIQVCK